MRGHPNAFLKIKPFGAVAMTGMIERNDPQCFRLSENARSTDIIFSPMEYTPDERKYLSVDPDIRRGRDRRESRCEEGPRRGCGGDSSAAVQLRQPHGGKLINLCSCLPQRHPPPLGVTLSQSGTMTNEMKTGYVKIPT